MLQTHIHVDVLDVHIHIANSALIVLALGLEVLDHRLKLVDFFKVTLDAARILSNLLAQKLVEVADVTAHGAQVVDNPLEHALQTLRGILQ